MTNNMLEVALCSAAAAVRDASRVKGWLETCRHQGEASQQQHVEAQIARHQEACAKAYRCSTLVLPKCTRNIY